MKSSSAMKPAVKHLGPALNARKKTAAVFAADGAARVTNKPSVVILTYGAGALNAVNAVAQAYVEHVPVIVVAGYPSAQEIERGLQIHHQAKHVDSQRSIFTEITATQVRIDRPETAGEKIRKAFQTAKEESRPVLIELPRNATEFQVKAIENYRPKPPNMQYVEHTLAPVITALQKAKRPVILAGVDVRRFAATAELEHLAARLNIPMLSTFMGRASIHQHHSMYRGIFLDKSDQHATQLLSEADCILQVGVIRTDSNFAANMTLFMAQLLTFFLMGWLIQAVSESHKLGFEYAQSYFIAALAPLPLWLSSLVLLIPIIWVNAIVGLAGFLLSSGMIVNGIRAMTREKGKDTEAMSSAIIVISASLIAWILLLVLIWAF